MKKLSKLLLNASIIIFIIVIFFAFQDMQGKVQTYLFNKVRLRV